MRSQLPNRPLLPFPCERRRLGARTRLGRDGDGVRACGLDCPHFCGASGWPLTPPQARSWVPTCTSNTPCSSNASVPRRLRIAKAKQEKVLLGRYADPIEISYAVAFLASPEADFITGQVISPNRRRRDRRDLTHRGWRTESVDCDQNCGSIFVPRFQIYWVLPSAASSIFERIGRDRYPSTSSAPSITPEKPGKRCSRFCMLPSNRSAATRGRRNSRPTSASGCRGIGITAFAAVDWRSPLPLRLRPLLSPGAHRPRAGSCPPPASP